MKGNTLNSLCDRDLGDNTSSPKRLRFAGHHDGTAHLAIKNSYLRRFPTLLALKTTAHFYKRNSYCRPISKKLIVKRGPWIHLTEAATMEFVAANTSSVPVPRVHCSFIHAGWAYIIMERIQGIPIGKIWYSLCEADREILLEQLRRIFRELRALPPPSPPIRTTAGVQSCVGGSLCDCRISKPDLVRFGPFETIQAFRLWLRDEFQPTEKPDHVSVQEWNDVEEMARKQDGPWPAPVFTHGDLNPSNILVRGNQVVGLIDWEFSGWYPHYWEYTAAWYGNRIYKSWQDAIPRFLDPYQEELKMEIMRNKYWGEY